MVLRSAAQISPLGNGSSAVPELHITPEMVSLAAAGITLVAAILDFIRRRRG
jgi:hypothetical protein